MPASRVLGVVLVCLSTMARPVAQPQDHAADAARLVELLALAPGMVVADIGAGSGLLTVPIARHIGTSGRLYATDINPERLAELRRLSPGPGAAPIVVIEGGSVRTGLADDCCDAVFMRHVYHHIAEPATMNAALRRALKPGGRLAIADFAPSGGVSGPPGRRDTDQSHGVTAATVVTELTAAGFVDVQEAAWPSRGYFVVTARRPPSAAASRGEPGR